MREGFKADAIAYEETMRARAAYFANVSYLDEVIGDLLLRLEAAGLLENTIIVYTTDHGEMAGEHGVWWKNGWYEACTRVPLIISLPEQRQGTLPPRSHHTPVAHVDLFPTLCALAGIEVSADLAPSVGGASLDGTDLSASIQGEALPSDRPIFCDALTPRWGTGTEFRMIRWQHYKYVRFRDHAPLFFDLANDPGEQRNLIERGIPQEDQAAHDHLAHIAETSIDFEAAERERLERDGALKQRYALDLPPATGNLYIMPNGTLINADDLLYNPTVISENPARAFEDWPQKDGA
jgi:choline-sulfatase